MSKKITIALDGYSSTGKSTLAKNLSKALGYGFIDTGAMYRTVALYALENNLIKEGQINEAELINSLPKINISFEHDRNSESNTTFLNGRKIESEIRDLAVTQWVSKISSIVAVRKYLVTLQQKMGAGKGVVLDGRDIGTVVFPNAELKIFMTADHDVRAKRRFEELSQKGIETTFEEVKKALAERDHEDETRTEGPLIKAKDAIVLDNTHLSREEQFEKALQWAKKAEERVN